MVDVSLDRALEAFRRIVAAVRWLRWPTFVLAFLAALPPIALAALSLTWQLTPRLVALAVVAVQTVVLVRFWLARRGTLRAADDGPGLEADLGALRDEVDFRGPVASDIAMRLEAVASGKRLGVIGRLRAAWRAVTIPAAMGEFFDGLTVLRWFMPPLILDTWARVVAVFWVALGGFAILVLAVVLSATPVV